MRSINDDALRVFTVPLARRVAPLPPWVEATQGRAASLTHPPITWELTIFFSATMSQWGRYAEAVAALLAFDCLLRVGELTRITFDEVGLGDDPRAGSTSTSNTIVRPRSCQD